MTAQAPITDKRYTSVRESLWSLSECVCVITLICFAYYLERMIVSHEQVVD